MNDQKTCFKCGVPKPLSEFYAHSRMADGHLNKCKDCTKADVQARIELKKMDPAWMHNERERGRVKAEAARKAGTNKQPSHEVREAYKARNPEKISARQVALATHPIQPECCERCKQPHSRLNRHHPDYSKPREIVWLCPGCHGIEHRIPATV